MTVSAGIAAVAAVTGAVSFALFLIGDAPANVDSETRKSFGCEYGCCYVGSVMPSSRYNMSAANRLRSHRYFRIPSMR